MSIKYDPRLIDLKLEISILESSLLVAKSQFSQLEELHRDIRDQFLKNVENTTNDFNTVFAWDQYENKLKFEIPRLVWSPFIISAFATFESGMFELAHEFQKINKHRIAIEDFNDRKLDKFKKYYDLVLNISLKDNNERWKTLKMLADIRNAIAHHNGRVKMLNSELQIKLENWAGENTGIGIENGYLIVYEQFANTACQNVISMLRELMGIYNKKHDEISNLRTS